MPPPPGAFDGRLLQFDVPVWDPLLELVGPRLVRWFMWMNAIALSDGREVQAYKHIATRRYLHLGNDGSAFEYTRRSRYRPLDHWDAVQEAFSGWEDLVPEPDMLDTRALADLLRALETLDDAAGTASA